MQERILELLSASGGEYVSGGELAKRLGCTRAAVWKHIEQLRLLGYEFEAVSRRGYRLLASPPKLDLPAIQAALKTKVMGRKLKYVDELPSTQTAVHELVQTTDATEGTLVIAESQVSGRGRMGRSWHSPKGKGIWMSFVLKPRISLQFAPQLTLLTAVALCRSIRRECAIEAGIKWPNDLLVSGKKISGILLESIAEDERVKYAVCGVGLSVNLQAADYPPELLPVATSLAIQSGRTMAREPIVAAFLNEFELLYDLYHEQGFEPIRTLWEALSVTLNRPVRVHTSQGVVQGTAVGLEKSGALQVQLEDGTIAAVFSGDITPVQTKA